MELRNLLTDFNILMLEIVDLMPQSKDKAIAQLKQEIESLQKLKENMEELDLDLYHHKQ